MFPLSATMLVVSQLLYYVFSLPLHQIPSLLDISIHELSELLHVGATTSVELVETYIARIEEVNLELHAVIEANPDAVRHATDLDLERAAGRIRGSLHGIPILVKDNIATADEMNNTAGSVCLVGARVSEESTVVSRLRKAGAIILGKANLSEWAGARSSFNTSDQGWSGYGGQTVGAYLLDQNPSGSSSGSAVAVSIGLAAAALGTETSGSIINPSQYNNLVGIKPTVGLTSRFMVIPVVIRQDTVGPIARTVTDATYILSAMAGKDPQDNYTSSQPFQEPPDYTAALNISSLDGARLGIPRNGIVDDNPNFDLILSAFNASLTTLSAAGATILDPAPFSLFDATPSEFVSWIRSNASILDRAEFPAGINNYLSHLVTNPRNISSLADLANCTMSSPAEAYPDHDISIWQDMLAKILSPSSLEVWIASQNLLYLSGEGSLLGTLDKYNLDALVLPTFTAASLAALAGTPVVTVPLGVLGEDAKTVRNPRGTLVDTGPGMPYGLSFLGRKWSEERLIGLAYAFEQRTMVRGKVKPMVVPERELKGYGTGRLKVQGGRGLV